MTDNQKNLKIVYYTHNSETHQQVYVSPNHVTNLYTIEDNVPFITTLKYLGYTRGRSALNIKWLDKDTNRICYSGMKFLNDKLVEGIVDGSEVTGQFIFHKKGTSILLTDYNE